MRTSEPPSSVSFHVRDLRVYLTRNQVSPEKFASDVHLSHMTIRRWLKRKDHEALPKKYSGTLRSAFSEVPMVEIPKFSIPGALARMNVREMMNDLEKNGREYGRSVETLEKDLHTKLKGVRLDQIFVAYCKRLIKAIRSPKTPLRVKAVCIGALLYFISPIDLIPDHIPVVGYLDDLAVLSIAVNVVAGMEGGESGDSAEGLPDVAAGRTT